jgi:phosphohistidine phosphatase
MHIALVRHGEAEAGGADDHRPLTTRGRTDTERVGRAALAAGLKVERIRHSGKRRALETAAILSDRLGASVDPEPLALLRPSASPIEAASWIESQREPQLLVTHLPLIELLASHLLSRTNDESPLPFPAATLLWLEAKDGLWRVRAHIVPESRGR